MQRKKVDYTSLSDCYDDTRVPLVKDVLELCLSKIADLGKTCPGSKVLDVGCGTGIYTIPLARKTDALVFGLDSSRDMIKKAKMKEDSRRVEWQVGDAENLPFYHSHFECVFMTLVIHQIVNKKRAVDEIFRVLRKDGRFVVMTKSHGQLSRSLIMDFPGARQIDFERFPTVPALKKILMSAGFRNVRYHVASAGIARVLLDDYLDGVQRKFISTLALLREEEFQKGFRSFEKRLREKWGRQETYEVTYRKEYTFVVGEK